VTVWESEVLDQTVDGVYCLGGADIHLYQTLFDGNETAIRCDESDPEISINTI